jgi:TP901 family phage tail tape measure protein
MAPSRKLAEIFYEVRAHTEGLDKDLAGAQRSFGKLTDFVLKNPVVAIAAVGTAALAASVKLAQMAASFESAMVKVNTVAKLSNAALGELGDKVQRLFTQLPVQNVNELTEGLYQLLSSGVPAARAMEALDVSARAAIGGFTDVRTVVDAVTSSMNAYKDENLSAGEAADVLARAVADGKIEFAEIAGSIGSVVGIAATFGVNIKEIAAVLTQLSLSGINASEGVTGLRAAILAVLRPSTEFRNEFPKLAESFDQTRLKRDGFVKFLLDFQKESGGSAKALQSLFRESRAYAAVVTLLKDGGDGLVESLGNMEQAAGSVNAAFQQVNETTAAVQQRIRNELSAALTELGTIVLPPITAGLKVLVELLASLRGRTSNQFGSRALTDFLQNADKAAANARDKFGDLTREWQFASDAAQRLSRAVDDGSVSLDSMSEGELQALIDKMIEFKNVVPLSFGFDHVQDAINNIVVAADQALQQLRTTAATTGTGRPDDIGETAGPSAEELKRRAKADREEREKAEKAFQQQLQNRLDILEGIRDAELALAQQSGDAVRVLEIQIEQTTEKFRALGATDEDIAAIVRPLEAAKKAAEGLLGAATKLDFGNLKEKLSTPLGLISDQVDKLRESLTKAGASEKEIARATTALAVEKLTQHFVDQGFALADAKQRAEEYVGAVSNVQSAAQKVAQAISDIGNALLSVAGALGAVDQGVQDIARGAINLGSGASRIAGGDVVGGGLQVIAGVGDLIKGIGAGDAEAERRHRENLATLQQIERHTGDLVGKSLTGRQQTGLTEGLRNVLDPSRAAEVLFDIGPALEKASGLTRREIEAIAQSLGVSLNFTKDSLQDFLDVLEKADFSGFADDFQGELQRFEALLRVEGITDPLEIMVRKLQVLTGPEGAPAIAKALEGLNLDTVEGRTAAIQRLTELFNNLPDLSAAERGGLSVSELYEQTIAFIEQLRALQPPTVDEFGVGSGKGSRFDKQLRQFDAIDLDLALRDITDALEQFQAKSSGLVAAFPELAEFFDQFDLTTIEGVKAFGDAVPDFIAGLKDGSIVIEGIAAEDIPKLINAFANLESAGDAAEAAVLSLADTLNSAFRDIDLDQAIFGGTDEDSFNKKFSRIIAGLPAPPGTGGGTPGGSFDLSTQAGRDEARKALQDLARLDPSLRPLIADLIRDLDNLPELVGDAVGEAVGGALGESRTLSASLQTLTVFQGDRLITLGESQLLQLQKIGGYLESITRSSAAGLVLPPATAAFAAGFGGGASVTSQNVLNINVHVPPGTTDPQAFGQSAGHAIVNELLADALIRERFFSGSSSVT